MPTIRAFITTYGTTIVILLALIWCIVAYRNWRYTMLLDAALITLFYARPWIGVLILGGTFTVWRYTSWLACDIADLVGAEQSIGLTRAVWRFVLVGWNDGQDTLPTAKAATGATTKLVPPPMPLRSMLSYVNGQPDKVPHLAIIGPSGSGKTTLATVVLSDRPGLIIVLTAKEGDAWGGLPYIGIDDDATYTTARITFDTLSTEVKTRLLSTKLHSDPGDWLTIVVDDFSTLQSECSKAPEVVKLVSRLGRALHVRLIMLSDSALVKAIGLEGEGETRANFAFVRLERGHAATLEIGGDTLPVDTRGADQITVQLSGREWSVPVPVVGINQGGNGTGNAGTGGNGASIEVLRALRAAGWTREQARNSGLQFRDQHWTDAT